MAQLTDIQLPGLDCGLCGFRTCGEFRDRLTSAPDLLRRCIHLAQAHRRDVATACQECATPRTAGVCAAAAPAICDLTVPSAQPAWRDHLDREFDFFLEHFPEEPGPREIILPHNPLLTRELNIQRGDVLIGRPLGMSCGCPITHCGVVTDVDHRTGVIVWCVTGPLGPRQQGFKDLGYYIAEAYEGLVRQSRCELKLGWRYFFQPRMCMLQWRHSGLINYLSRNAEGYQIRIEGLWIG
jgi:uncharacterized Fe-S cluster-containing protein